MTSANVTEYRIIKNGKVVGHHRQNWMCNTNWDQLLKYTPLEDHQIIAFGYDEDEEYWEDDEQNLRTFLSRYISDRRNNEINKILK